MSDPRQEYTNFHRRLRRVRGPASNQTCVDCKGRAAHWSWKGGCGETAGDAFFVDDFDAYEPRCVKCHVRKDRDGYVVSEETRLKMRDSQTGTTHTPETRRKISQALRKYEKTPEHREALSRAAKARYAKGRNDG